MSTTATEYHLTITAPRKKFRQAVNAQRRYGGEFDPAAKAWIYTDEPHPSAAQWGEVVEVEADDETGDYDYDYEARL